jgi:four helix bundle protein
MEYQRFDVYRVALGFQVLVPQLFPRRGSAALRGQLDRASASILLNIAEGCGRFSRGDKAQFYRIARGSAMESAAVLDILLSRGLIAPSVHRHGHGLLVRVTQMLTRLIQRMQRRRDDQLERRRLAAWHHSGPQAAVVGGRDPRIIGR